MNTQPRHPKCRALPVELHPDIHFSVMIPRRAVKIKIFLSVVIYVVKADFIPLSATGENPANAGVARLCGVSPHLIPDTATALPNAARYQLRYTPIVIKLWSCKWSNLWSNTVLTAFFHLPNRPKSARLKGFRRLSLSYSANTVYAPKAGALPTALHPVIQFFIRLVVFSQIKRDTSFATPGYLVLWGVNLYMERCAGDAACKATAWSIDSADGVCAGRCGGDNAYPTMFRGKKQQGAGRFSAGTLFCVSSKRALRSCVP